MTALGDDGNTEKDLKRRTRCCFLASYLSSVTNDRSLWQAQRMKLTVGQYMRMVIRADIDLFQKAVYTHKMAVPLDGHSLFSSCTTKPRTLVWGFMAENLLYARSV